MQVQLKTAHSARCSWDGDHNSLPRFCALLSSCVLSHFQCTATPCPWVHALCQAPLSMRFFRQEYWSGLPSPPPGDLPDPRIKLVSPVLQADSLLLSHQGSSMVVVMKWKTLLSMVSGKAFNSEYSRVV